MPTPVETAIRSADLVAALPRSLSAAANVPGDDIEHDAEGDPAHGGHHADEHDDHGPHESGKLILVPIVILAFLALTSGFVNPAPLAGDALGANLGEGVELLKKYVEPRYEPVYIDETGGHAGESIQLIEAGTFVAAESGGEGESDAYATGCGRSTPEPGTVCYFPKVKHAVPELSKILLSLGVVALGYAAAIGFCIAFYKNKNPRLVGLTERSRIARGGYLFLKNKYYLDVLYQNVFVYFVSRPLAKATYWFNQNVIDGAVNGVATAVRATATETRKAQTGYVRQYAAIIGVGNCASSLVPGVEFYKDADPADFVPGLMHVQFREYHVRDVQFVAAFDVDGKKVGLDLADAIGVFGEAVGEVAGGEFFQHAEVKPLQPCEQAAAQLLAHL